VGALHPAVRVVSVPHSGRTPVKKRVRAGAQPLLRLDSGGGGELGDLPPALDQVLRSARAVVVADYGRGMTAHAHVRELLAGLPRSLPVVWDPHPRGASPVPGARLVTPNLAEAVAMAGITDAGSSLSAAGQAARALVERWAAGAVAVTLGSRGALVSMGAGAPAVVPAPDVDCVDPCGAGDRFASAAAVALGAGALATEAVQEAVRAASEFVAAGGASGLHTPPMVAPAAARRTPRRWPVAYVRRAAPSSPPEAASTCCTPGTSRACGPPAASATAWWSASTPTAR
jgi:bifunctional ADP-heptose synthase (sugar kinase/adenylyltransferase)